MLPEVSISDDWTYQFNENHSSQLICPHVYFLTSEKNYAGCIMHHIIPSTVRKMPDPARYTKKIYQLLSSNCLQVGLPIPRVTALWCRAHYTSIFQV